VPDRVGLSLVEIKIGIAQINKELTIETPATDDEVTALLQAALTEGPGLLHLNDGKGRHLIVPADKIGYLEFGQEPHRPVGFGVLGT